MGFIPSGDDCDIAIEIDIIYFPIDNGDFPRLCNKLPEDMSVDLWME